MSCPICAEDFGEGPTSASGLPCGHVFHRNCLTRWWAQGAERQCPTCRSFCPQGFVIPRLFLPTPNSPQRPNAQAQLSMRLKAAEEKAKMCEKRATSLETRVRTEEEKVAMARGEIEDLQRSMGKANAKLRTEEEKVAGARGEIADLQRSLTVARGETEGLQRSLDKANAKLRLTNALSLSQRKSKEELLRDHDLDSIAEFAVQLQAKLSYLEKKKGTAAKRGEAAEVAHVERISRARTSNAHQSEARSPAKRARRASSLATATAAAATANAANAATAFIAAPRRPSTRSSIPIPSIPTSPIPNPNNNRNALPVLITIDE